MSERTGAPAPSRPYTEFHPRWHRARVSTWWWLRRWDYFKFIVRELTSVGVAFAAAVFLLYLRALAAGPGAYAALEARLRSPVAVALSVAGLLFGLYHAVTWFNLAPRAMVVRFRGRRVPDRTIVAANYAAFALASAAVAWLVIEASAP